MAPETGPHRKCINMRLMFGTWGHNVTLLTRPDGQNFLNLNVLDILSDLMNAAGKQKLYDLHAIVVMCRKSRKRKPTVNNVDSIQKTRLKAAWSQRRDPETRGEHWQQWEKKLFTRRRRWPCKWTIAPVWPVSRRRTEGRAARYFGRLDWMIRDAAGVLGPTAVNNNDIAWSLPCACYAVSAWRSARSTDR